MTAARFAFLSGAVAFALFGIADLCLAAESIQLCTFSELPVPSDASLRCRAAHASAVNRCEALTEIEDDAELTEVATLRRACYVTYHCSFVEPAFQSKCRDLAAGSLAIRRTESVPVAILRWHDLQKAVDNAADRVARRGGYAVNVMLAAFEPLFPQASYRAEMDQLLANVVRAISEERSERCESLQKIVRAYVEQTPSDLTPDTPLSRELLSKLLAPGGCLARMMQSSNERIALQKLLQEFEFVTVSAAPDDALTLIIDRLSWRDVPPEHAISIGNRLVFFAAVPRSSTVTMRIETRSDLNTMPALKTVVASLPIEWWLSERSCARILLAVGSAKQSASTEAATPAAPLLLVDGMASRLEGQASTPGLYEWTALLRVAKAKYKVTIIYQYKNETRFERMQLDLTQQEPWGACIARRIDLSERRAVALLPVSVSPQCREAGVDGAVLHDLARASLQPVIRMAQREWQDFETWQKTLAWMGALPAELRVRSAQDNKQDVDAFSRFQVYGKELLAQGIREAVDVELICDRKQSDGYRFAVRATKINVDEANRRRVDLLNGRSISGILEDEGATTASRGGLDGILRDVFKRLFRIPYVTRTDGNSTFAHRERASIRVDAYVPETSGKQQVRLRAVHIKQSSADVCTDNEWSESSDAVSQTVVRDSSVLRGAGPRHAAYLGFVPAAPGVYLLQVSLRPIDPPLKGDPAIAANPAVSTHQVPANKPSTTSGQTQIYTCVRVKPSAASFWAGVSADMALRSDRVHSSQTLNVGLRLTLSDSVASGAALGLRLRSYGYNSAVSWSDHFEGVGRPLPNYNDTGNLNFSWYRYSVPISVFYETALFNTSFLFARISPELDMALIDTRGIPTGLRHFLKGRKAGDLVFDIDLDIRVELEVREPIFGLGVSLVGGVVGIDDAIGGLLDTRERSVVSYDHAWFIGLGARWTS